MTMKQKTRHTQHFQFAVLLFQKWNKAREGYYVLPGESAPSPCTRLGDARLQYTEAHKGVERGNMGNMGGDGVPGGSGMTSLSLGKL